MDRAAATHFLDILLDDRCECVIDERMHGKQYVAKCELGDQATVDESTELLVVFVQVVSAMKLSAYNKQLSN